MQKVISIPFNVRHVGLGLAAAILVAAATTSFANFQASSPGSDLEPVGGAESVIDLIQGQETILWTSVGRNVVTIRTVGWPSSDGTHELGGALSLIAPRDQRTGIVDFGDKPMSMTFSLDD